MRSDDPRFPGELAGIEIIEGDDTVTLVARTRSEAAMLANAHRNLGLIAPYGVAPRALVFPRHGVDQWPLVDAQRVPFARTADEPGRNEPGPGGTPLQRTMGGSVA